MAQDDGYLYTAPPHSNWGPKWRTFYLQRHKSCQLWRLCTILWLIPFLWHTRESMCLSFLAFPVLIWGTFWIVTINDWAVGCASPWKVRCVKSCCVGFGSVGYLYNNGWARRVPTWFPAQNRFLHFSKVFLTVPWAYMTLPVIRWSQQKVIQL